MKSLKTSLPFKIGIIVIIGILLLIPATMIKNLIRERENRQKEAINEVSSKWGEEQIITGPFISIPYIKYVRQYSNQNSEYKLVKVKDYIHILPSDLKISGEINPERRHRGIYDIVVYNSLINISGSFDNSSFTDFDIPYDNILFDKAVLSLGISDMRGIQKQVSVKWNDSVRSFNPGTVSNEVVENGINTPIKINDSGKVSYGFSLSLDLKGSQKLYFVPVGKVSDVTLTSGWKNPSFNGAFLPDKRTIGATGFKANWNILNLNRNFPQHWKGNLYKIDESAFGVNLLLPVDNYQKSMRSVKYALLFIGFTFIVFFFVEVLNRVFIHPVQYILVGIALVVFYILLLSVSEQLGFNAAFTISAVSTLLLIAGYTKAILKSGRLTLLITGILSILYTFIFIIIQLQDYALLMGSIGVFIILGLVMYFSRKIDWYNLNLKENE